MIWTTSRCAINELEYNSVVPWAHKCLTLCSFTAFKYTLWPGENVDRVRKIGYMPSQTDTCLSSLSFFIAQFQVFFLPFKWGHQPPAFTFLAFQPPGIYPCMVVPLHFHLLFPHKWLPIVLLPPACQGWCSLSCSASTFYGSSQSITDGVSPAGTTERTAWGRTKKVYLTLTRSGLLKESSEIIYEQNTEEKPEFSASLNVSLHFLYIPLIS